MMLRHGIGPVAGRLPPGVSGMLRTIGKALLVTMPAVALSGAPQAPPVGALPAVGTYRLERIMAVPDGTVLDSDGHERPFSRYTTGKVTLLAFIYTRCADACPLAYGIFQDVKARMDAIPGVNNRVRLVSISFDPQHDTPEVMRAYGGDAGRDRKGIRWHFLTTRSARQLRPLLDGMGQDASVLAIRPEGSDMSVLMHMLKVFLIDPHGEVREIYTSSYLLTEVVVNDIQTLLMGEKSAAVR